MSRRVKGKATSYDVKAGPICKAAGGKGRLTKTLLASFPRGWTGRYIEPFCGGAALYFALPEARQEGAILADANVDIIETYAALVHDVEAVIRVLRVHSEAHGRMHYYEVRKMFNDPIGEQSIYERAAAFLYLNRACYNGLWRVNKSGGMNVPAGDYASVEVRPDQLRVAATALGSAKIVAGDYRHVTAMALSGDLCYFDPPYDGTYSSYTANGFGFDDQGDLAAEFAHLAKRGVHVLASNANTEHVRELYRDYFICEISAPRSISCEGDGRKPVKELLISSYRPAALDVVGGDAAQHGRWFRENLELPFGGAVVSRSDVKVELEMQRSSSDLRKVEHMPGIQRKKGLHAIPSVIQLPGGHTLQSVNFRVVQYDADGRPKLFEILPPGVQRERGDWALFGSEAQLRKPHPDHAPKQVANQDPYQP